MTMTTESTKIQERRRHLSGQDVVVVDDDNDNSTTATETAPAPATQSIPMSSSPSSSPSPPPPSSFVRPVFESSICDLFGRRRQRRRATTSTMNRHHTSQRQRGYYVTTSNAAITAAATTTTNNSSSSRSSSSRKTDACAVAICGGLCLLQQRNEFLLTRQKPKPILSWKHRSVEIFMVMLGLILIVISTVVDDPYQYNMMWSVTGLLLLSCIYKLFDFLHSSRIFRQQLAIYQWEMLLQQQQQYQEQQEQDQEQQQQHCHDHGNGIDPGLESYLSYHNDEVYGNGSHVLCGCARDIEDEDDYYYYEEEGEDEEHHHQHQHHHNHDNNYHGDDILTTNSNENNNDESTHADEDFCTDLWTFVANSCCGAVCQCYCQVCGACATSQEHRHLRTLMPRPMKLSEATILSKQAQRQRQRQTARAGTTAPRSSSIDRSSSSTSRGTSSDTNGIYMAAADLWQRDYMTFEPWMEYYPSILKLRLGNVTSFTKHVQALSVLSFRLVVSSVIFLGVATTMAIFLPVTFPRWQILVLYGTLLQPLIIMFFVHWVWHRLDLSMDAVIKYFASGFFLCTGMSILYEMIMSVLSSMVIFLVTIISATGLVLFGDDEDAITFKRRKGYQDDDDDDAVDMDRFTPTLHLPIQLTFVLAIVAALVNAFLVAALVEELSKYLSFSMVEHPDVERENIVLLPPLDDSEGKARDGQKCNGNGDEEDEVEVGESSKLVRQSNVSDAGTYDRRQLIASPIASSVSAGAAITVAMVATALGFACAENLLYVFLYTPPGLDAELSTLMIRCLFPIHPLAAALQSIGVVRRDLERDPSVGVGRIIFPAWLMHGTFDFALMVFALVSQVLKSKSSYGSMAGNSILFHGVTPMASITEADDDDDDDDQSSTYVISFVLIIPVIGMVYYFQEAWEQRDRLEVLDQRIGVRTTSSQSEDGRRSNSHRAGGNTLKRREAPLE